MKNEIILVDVDGCLLNWEGAFTKWMKMLGYKFQHADYKTTYNLEERYGISHDEKMFVVRNFNESSAIEFLEPHRDAEKYIKLINQEHKYKFHVITSMSENSKARDRRIKNLKNIFGDVFSDYIFLDTGADKYEVLGQFKDTECFWIEDKEENAQAGLDVGLRSLIMEHGFNMHSNIAPRIKNWEEFYNKYIV